jgi:hypothetical protein
MVRRRSTVRFRNGAPVHTLERWRPTWADQVRRHLCVVRLATADTGSQRLAVPNTCPSLSRAVRVRSCYASSAVSAGRHARRAPFAGMWANGHPATFMLAPGCSPWRPQSEPATSRDAVTDGGGGAGMRRASNRRYLNPGFGCPCCSRRGCFVCLLPRGGHVTRTVSPPQTVQISFSLLFLELSGYYVNAVQLHVHAADVLVRCGIHREDLR